jgi:hypothetical protein
VQIDGQCLGRIPVREPVQGPQHDHRGDQTPTGREQDREQLVTEQVMAMLGQEREHPALGQGMTGH